MTTKEIDRLLDRLVGWVRKNCARAHMLYVPISGSDSSLCFWACSKALPGKTVGAHVGETLRGENWFRSLGEVWLTPPVNAPLVDPDVLRWALLHAKAKTDRGWLVGTRNRTEHIMGTFSLASRLPTVQPLLRLWKMQVMELARHVGVPEEILLSSRKADPDCGRPKELAEIGLELVDFFAQCKEKHRESLLPQQLSASQIAYLEGIYQFNLFKRQLPLSPRWR